MQSQVGYVSPEEFNKGFSLKPDDYSDIGQAKVLSREYAGELVFTDSTDYMRYDGTHWAESKQMAVGACEEFLDEQLKEAIAAVEKAKKMLLDAGIDKDTVMAGGKALEKLLMKEVKSIQGICDCIKILCLCYETKGYEVCNFCTSGSKANAP